MGFKGSFELGLLPATKGSTSSPAAGDPAIAQGCGLASQWTTLLCSQQRQSPGGELMRTVLQTFHYERCHAENQTHLSQPQAGLRHDSLYNHQQLFLCWLGLNLH